VCAEILRATRSASSPGDLTAQHSGFAFGQAVQGHPERARGSLAMMLARRRGQTSADGSRHRDDVDRDSRIDCDQSPDSDGLAVFCAHVWRDAGLHMDGVACPGALVVMPGGKLRVALAPNLDRLLRESGKSPPLVRVARPEVSLYDHRRGVSSQCPQQFHCRRAKRAGLGQIRRWRAEGIVQRFLELVLANQGESQFGSKRDRQAGLACSRRPGNEHHLT
jgi:hypothetical protein